MKIKKLIPFMFLASILLSACSMSETYIPKRGGSVSFNPDQSDVSSEITSTDTSLTSGGGRDDEEEEKNTVIEFYFSNTYSETPIFSIDWYMLKPLGSIPEEVSTTEKVKALGQQAGYVIDDRFPTFIGFSFYSTCLDEEKLWDFSKDYKQQAVTCLYGIWVSE